MSDPGCISFAELPETSRLFLDYVNDFERVGRFYSVAPKLSGLTSRTRVAYPEERRARIASILERQNRGFGAGEKTFANIQRFRRGANAIVTGQQVVLFGGPSYSLYKALTAIKLADALTRAGSDHVPTFWLATQDHDFAEVQHVTLRSGQGKLEKFSVASPASAGTPVSQIPLGEDAASEARRAAELLGESDVPQLLLRCYRKGETLGSAMGKLFAALFAERGLVLFDPSDPEVAAEANPLFERAIQDAPAIANALVARGKELDSAGYHQQVKVTGSTALFFVQQKEIRTAVHVSNGAFSVGSQKISAKELGARLQAHPEDFSGNALLRPVVQDFLLPTTAYVGGPAEVAYFAQSNVVYEKLLGSVTPIVPRFSATLLDARDHRLLQQYKLVPLDVLKSGSHLGEELSRRALPGDVSERIAAAEQALDQAFPALRESLTKLDTTLADAAKHAQSKMAYQLSKLRGMAARAQLRRSQELARHAGILSTSALPNGKLQEREIGGISFIAQFGQDVLTRLYDAIQPECFGHRFIQL